MKESKIILPGRYSALASLNRLLNGAAYCDAKFFIFLDENVYQHCLPLLISRVSALEQAEFMEVPCGEESKTIEIAAQLWGALLESGADRNSVIINLGGGCVSDLGGFVAAGYMRGIRSINIPTTLVGMVDAALGGKTAVDVEGAKNIVGFFHMPEMVCIEPAFLDSLPDAEMRSGLYEVIKTMAVGNKEQYDSLLAMMEQSNVCITDELLSECATFKSAVVKADPYDQGIRHILNFGHTFGHAIEAFSLSSKRPYLHGEAVALGMVCAMSLSVKVMGFPSEEYERWRKIVEASLPMPHYSLRDSEQLLTLLRKDKKNEEGQILCVLLQQIGVPVVDVSVEENLVRDVLLSLGK